MQKFLLIIAILLVGTYSYSQSKSVDTSYFENGTIEGIATYKKGKLVTEVHYNEGGELLFQSPLSKKQTQINYHFKSGRTYYAQNSRDTLIFDKNVPPANFVITHNNVCITRIGLYSYIIESCHWEHSSDKAKIIIEVCTNTFTSPQKKFKKEIPTAM